MQVVLIRSFLPLFLGSGAMAPVMDVLVDPNADSPYNQPICAKEMDYEIIDKVKVPDLQPGRYVLSFRWDCEQTPQIWSQCSDIEITASEMIVSECLSLGLGER